MKDWEAEKSENRAELDVLHDSTVCTCTPGVMLNQTQLYRGGKKNQDTQATYKWRIKAMYKTGGGWSKFGTWKWTYKPADNSANRTDFTVEQVTIMLKGPESRWVSQASPRGGLGACVCWGGSQHHADPWGGGHGHLAGQLAHKNMLQLYWWGCLKPTWMRFTVLTSRIRCFCLRGEGG